MCQRRHIDRSRVWPARLGLFLAASVLLETYRMLAWSWGDVEIAYEGPAGITAVSTANGQERIIARRPLRINGIPITLLPSRQRATSRSLTPTGKNGADLP